MLQGNMYTTNAGNITFLGSSYIYKNEVIAII
ncbi:MAG: hypothetical protein KatS3mg044_1235 [Rhodothermaceae bacterium]|nr:MAG: hypothetical protein KatS3mg044_1235 [Rhodothermaceae bacterium]